MLEIDCTKDYGLPLNKFEDLRAMRIGRYPIQVEGNIIVDDRLEEEGFIRLYEYVGGIFYTPRNSYEMENSENTVLVGEISISVKKKEMHINRLFCEYGYGFGHSLFQQVLFFADLYDLSISILNLKKRKPDYHNSI